MTIHKEGYVSILVAAVLLTLLNVIVRYFAADFPLVTMPILFLSIVFFLLIVYFFRKPQFDIARNDQQVLSPADGKVVAIEKVTEGEYFNDKRVQISVFMSPLNVHMNRYPIAGAIKYFKHHNGHFHVAWHPKSSTENERTTTVVQDAKGTEVLFRQIAGAVARRIVSYAKVGDTIGQGQECGFIKFGSRVDVLLPVDTNINVKIGDKVLGGKTVLASF